MSNNKEKTQEYLDRNNEIEVGITIVTIESNLLSSSICQNASRLEASMDSPQFNDPVMQAYHDIKWPTDTNFQTSILKFQELMSILGINCEYEELEKIIPLKVNDFAFLKDPTTIGFWPGWHKEFSAIDHEIVFPLGADDTYFYFISHNSQEPEDPIILKLRNDAIDVTPESAPGMTLDCLLSCLIRQ